MSDQYFSFLRDHGNKLDEDLKDLTETWKHPANILGGYGANEEEAEANLHILQTEITTLERDIANNAESRKTHIDEMENFLKESQQTIDDLVKSCNDIGTVLSEYGYAKPKDESATDEISGIESGSDSSLVSSDETTGHVEVEFTPDLTWRRKAKTNLP